MARKSILGIVSSHQVPQVFAPLIETLRNHPGIVRVGVGRFTMGSKVHESRLEIHSTDPDKMLLKLTAYHEDARQDYFLTIRPESIIELGYFINNYSF